MSPSAAASREPPSSSECALARGRPEAWTRKLDVLLGAPQELAAVRLGHAERLRDLGVLVVEDLVEDEHGALGRRRAARAGAAAPWRRTRPPREPWPRLGPGSVTSGSGSHSPTYSSRRERRGLELVDAEAAHDRDEEGSRRADLVGGAPARCQRRNASWSTSSASATLPSMRYAIENRSARCSSNAASAVARCRVSAGRDSAGRIRVAVS